MDPEVDEILDDGNVLHDEGITIEVNHTNTVSNSNGEIRKQNVVHKEGSGHVLVLSCPLFAEKSMVSDPWSTKWLKDLHGGADIIFTGKRKFFKAGKRKVNNVPEGGVGLA